MLILKHLLAQLGFSVYMAATADKGLDLVHAQQPQLLVWELNARHETDFNMLQDVQKDQWRPYVILLSTPQTLDDDAPISQLTSGDVFIKPFEPAHLIRRIKALIKQEKI